MGKHGVGPLGVGTLVVKPERHVIHVAVLTGGEPAVMGRVLHSAAQVITDILETDQVYISLWSHADRRPGAIRYVVQPVDQAATARHGSQGPKLQALMFENDEPPDPAAVEEFASHARERWNTAKLTSVAFTGREIGAEEQGV